MAHIPVLLQEVIQALNPKPGEFFIDGTLGSGGHAKEILERLQPAGKFLGVDRDPGAIAAFSKSLEGVYYALEKVLALNQSYADLPEILARHDLGRADGLLLDLGFSSEQLSGSLKGRGFSFQTDEPLLMTHDRKDPPLSEILSKLPETELASTLAELSDERYAARIAFHITRQVKEGKMQTTGDLVQAVQEAIPKSYELGRLHPATRTFMALRMYVNRELEHLENLLKQLPGILKPGARVAIITFHSGEDRLVKDYFRNYAHSSPIILELINKKPITASQDEIKRNPRARSAKLRIAKFI